MSSDSFLIKLNGKWVYFPSNDGVMSMEDAKKDGFEVKKINNGDSND